jgi:hypothetical protein
MRNGYGTWLTYSCWMQRNSSLIVLSDHLKTAIVDYVLSQPIVIERSPPITVTLKGLLTATNLPIWIGTYMGWSVVPDHSVLLFITVPGGIIVVSFATGLALALSAGLSKSIKRLFHIVK